MLDTAELEQLKKARPTLWLLWGAMVVSLGIYLVIANLLGAEIQVRDMAPTTLELLLTLFAPLSAIELLFAVWLRKRMLEGKFPNQPRPAANQQHPIVGQYLTTMVICLALCESVGIYGFILSLLGESVETLYLFVGAATLGMLYFRPRLDELEALALRKLAESREPTRR